MARKRDFRIGVEVKSVNKLAPGFRAAEREVNTFAGRISQTAAVASRSVAGIVAGQVAVAAAAGTAAIGGTVIAGLRQFSEFEKRITEVWTLLPQVSQQGFDKMAEQARQFAKDTAFPVEDATRAIYQAISAGIPHDNIFQFMSVAADVARGGVTNLATSVYGLAAATNAYRHENLSARDAADSLFTTVKFGVTTAEQLTPVLGFIAAAAVLMGASFDEANAAFAALTKQGLSVDIAKVQVARFMNELADETKGAGQAFYEFTGVSVPEFLKAGHDMEDVLMKLIEMSEATGQTQMQMFTEIRGGRAATLLTGNALQDYLMIMGEMETKAGAAEEAAGKMKDTLSYGWESIRAEWKDFLIDIGEDIETFAVDGIAILKELIGFIANVKNEVTNAWAQLGGGGPRTHTDPVSQAWYQMQDWGEQGWGTAVDWMRGPARDALAGGWNWAWGGGMDQAVWNWVTGAQGQGPSPGAPFGPYEPYFPGGYTQADLDEMVRRATGVGGESFLIPGTTGNFPYSYPVNLGGDAGTRWDPSRTGQFTPLPAGGFGWLQHMPGAGPGGGHTPQTMATLRALGFGTTGWSTIPTEITPIAGGGPMHGLGPNVTNLDIWRQMWEEQQAADEEAQRAADKAAAEAERAAADALRVAEKQAAAIERQTDTFASAYQSQLLAQNEGVEIQRQIAEAQREEDDKRVEQLTEQLVQNAAAQVAASDQYDAAQQALGELLQGTGVTTHEILRAIKGAVDAEAAAVVSLFQKMGGGGSFINPVTGQRTFVPGEMHAIPEGLEGDELAAFLSRNAAPPPRASDQQVTAHRNAEMAAYEAEHEYEEYRKELATTIFTNPEQAARAKARLWSMYQRARAARAKANAAKREVRDSGGWSGGEPDYRKAFDAQLEREAKFLAGIEIGGIEDGKALDLTLTVEEAVVGRTFVLKSELERGGTIVRGLRDCG